MKIFDACLLRLKTAAQITSDQEIAALLGMTKAALSDRKRRDAFPEEKLRALAQQRPDLGLDVDFVLTGVTEAESLAQRAALHAAAGVPSEQRASHQSEADLLSIYRACPPDIQEALLVLIGRIATTMTRNPPLTTDGRYPKAVDEAPRTVHSRRRKSL